MIEKIRLLTLSCLALSGPLMAQTDTGSVYRLGTVTVEASAAQRDATVLLPAGTIQKMNRLTVPEALDLLPGISRSLIGPRNESVAFVRGGDLRQVPLFIDGIPVYVPYDGYVDLGRFTVFDLSGIQVSKGNSSVLYGANTLGGAINLVTRKPSRPLELNGALGWLSGGQRMHLNAGASFGKFYAQLGGSYYRRDHFSLSEKFTPTAIEDGGRRGNAFNEDNKLSFKLGFVPNRRSEYAIGYVRQHGKKGTPVYTGSDTLNPQYSRPRFWQWPYWDKESLYFISRTTVGASGYLKTRLFHDRFGNELNSYDDASYMSQDRPYAFKSIYDDYTLGGALEYGTERLESHYLKAAVHYKKDVHREFGPEDPRLTMSDYTMSFGAEDAFRISERFRAVAGLSYHVRGSYNADNYDPELDEITSLPGNASHAVNGQLSFSYSWNGPGRNKPGNLLFLSAARKTRFATIKDRYSYRMGTALPNPDLKPENAWNFEIGARKELIPSITVRPALFYSRISDIIQMVDNAVYDQPGDLWLAQQRNAGRAAFYGAEIQLTGAFTDKLGAGLHYNFVKRENLSNPDLLFTDVPEHKFFGYLDCDLIEAVRIIASLEYNSKRLSTSYGTVTPAYTLVNLKAAFKVWRQVYLEAGVNNLLDRNYAYTEGYPEPGRNAYVNLRFSYR